MIASLIMLSVAAVPGTPEPPGPVDPRDAWLTWYNDNWGILSDGRDDYRTNSFALAARVYQQVRLLVRYDMLTSRDGGTREDQALLGAAWKDADITVVDLWPCVGLRLDGDLGGERVQNAWHGPNSQVDGLAYDRRELALYLGGYVHWAWRPYQRIWPDLSAGGTVDSHGSILADATARGVLRLGPVDVWAGLCYQHRQSGDETEHDVARFERGLWVDYGIALEETLIINSRWGLRQDDIVGAVSVQFDF